MSELSWLKSSFSGEGGNNCVEIAAPTPESIAVREGESPARVLTTDRAALRALMRSVKADQLT
ncbi:DUF397 domain-containing protein [Streptomyces europaeiscabiei]|uniref:DUF397 domain-containing protein n=1 Tax=Streptomyces europaeiscabiei TaxID=146819 RepID=UPI00062830AA|nr:DUF397 domain-containing protein [Streptomyces europaeiscabiei]MDX3669652.1 DUF397 domain-containing protein [Streptomyces europaeiscabiei]